MSICSPLAWSHVRPIQKKCCNDYLLINQKHHLRQTSGRTSNHSKNTGSSFIPSAGPKELDWIIIQMHTCRDTLAPLTIQEASLKGIAKKPLQHYFKGSLTTSVTLAPKPTWPIALMLDLSLLEVKPRNKWGLRKIGCQQKSVNARNGEVWATKWILGPQFEKHLGPCTKLNRFYALPKVTQIIHDPRTSA